MIHKHYWRLIKIKAKNKISAHQTSETIGSALLLTDYLSNDTYSDVNNGTLRSNGKSKFAKFSEKQKNK